VSERPILFSSDMVNAILEGRKTQTRRVVKPQPPKGTESVMFNPSHFEPDYGFYFAPEGGFNKCPYGKVGDQLWVRENGWETPFRTEKMRRNGADTWEDFYYDADGLEQMDIDFFKEHGFKRRPSIHQKRTHSRIQLEITNIRVERLNDISESDCEKEGALDDGFIAALNANADEGYPIDQTIDLDESAKNQFIELWESINGKGSWEQNPWVWVVEFKHLTNPPRLKDY